MTTTDQSAATGALTGRGEGLGDPTLDALATMSGGNDAVAQLALLYARAFEDNPAAAFGMLAVTMTMVQQDVSEIHGWVGGVRERVQPFIDDPNLLRESVLSSLPPQLRMMLAG